MTKTALVTGGSSGIGYAIADALRDRGYAVVITGRAQESLREAATRLGVDHCGCDLRRMEDLDAVAGRFADSGLDVLVNCAGIAKPLPVAAYTLDNFQEHIEVNLRAPIFLIERLLPALTRRGGCVVNISSIITRRGAAAFGIYAATKGALESFTRNVARELAPQGVRINAICPGAIETPMFDKFGLPPQAAAAARDNALSTIPLGRFGMPADIAAAVLAQVENPYVTGAVWNVDGGVDT